MNVYEKLMPLMGTETIVDSTELQLKELETFVNHLGFEFTTNKDSGKIHISKYGKYISLANAVDLFNTNGLCNNGLTHLLRPFRLDTWDIENAVSNKVVSSIYLYRTKGTIKATKHLLRFIG